MDPTQWVEMARIASELTVIGVLVVWLYNERQERKTLRDAILSDWRRDRDLDYQEKILWPKSIENTNTANDDAVL